MRPEKKFLDFDLSDTDIILNGQHASKTGVHNDSSTIVDIPQGTGESQRIGRKCTLTNILMRLEFQSIINQVSAADLVGADRGTVKIRVILYLDKQCNGTAAGATDILQNNSYNEYMNLANKQRFRILTDKLFVMNSNIIAAGTAAANDTAVVLKNRIIKIHKKVFIPIEYDSTGGLENEIRSNNVGIFFWSSSAGKVALISSACRIRFIDY